MSSAATSDYAALRDFRAFELLNTLRWSVSLESFKALTTLGTAAVLLLGTLVLGAGLAALRDSLSASDTESTLWLGVLVIAYISTVLLLSELVSNRRLAVTGSPHLELFRAMELPIHHVVLRYGVLPLSRRLALLWYSAGVFFVVFFDADPPYLGALSTAVALLVLTSTASLFCVLRLASSFAQHQSLRVSSCFAALFSGLLLGAATSLLVGTGAIVSSQAVAGFLPWICGVLLLLGLLFGFWSVRRWRHLAYRKIIGAQQAQMSFTRPPKLWAMLLRELLSSRQGSVISVTALTWMGVLGCLLGAWLILPVGVGSSMDLHRALVGATIILSLGTTEPVLHRIGPTTRLFAMRFAWENGLAAPAILKSLMALYYVLAASVGCFVCCAAYLLFGTPVPSLILVSVIVMAAGIISEFVARPAVSTDGTKSADIMDALYTLVLVAPCSAVLALEPLHSTMLLLCYALILTIGVAFCLRTSLLTFRCPSGQ